MEILRSIKEQAILVPAIFAKSMLTATLVASSAETLNQINYNTPIVEAATLYQSDRPSEDQTDWRLLFGTFSIVLGALGIGLLKILNDD